MHQLWVWHLPPHWARVWSSPLSQRAEAGSPPDFLNLSFNSATYWLWVLGKLIHLVNLNLFICKWGGGASSYLPHRVAVGSLLTLVELTVQGWHLGHTVTPRGWWRSGAPSQNPVFRQTKFRGWQMKSTAIPWITAVEKWSTLLS